MATFFSQTFGQDRAEMVARVLEIQTEAYGYLDVPILSRELSRYDGGEALDVGTGDGSFLLKIAERNPALNYRGIEPDAELLAKAESRLAKIRLPNVQLAQAEFDSDYKNKHDVILARFTLQHAGKPQEFVQNAYNALNPGGGFFCIEPVYGFYDCEPPQKIWREFRERMLATYARWQSHPNIPKQICPWLSAAGFESISVSLNLHSPITIGHDCFEAVVLATAAMLNLHHPDIWEASFLEKLERWLQNLAGDPFISIAHVMAFKPQRFDFNYGNQNHRAFQGDALYIRSMAVAPGARKQGIGKTLVERVESFAKADGFRRMFLSTTPFLQETIRLYERFGFKRTNDEPHELAGTPLFTMDKALTS